MYFYYMWAFLPWRWYRRETLTHWLEPPFWNRAIPTYRLRYHEPIIYTHEKCFEDQTFWEINIHVHTHRPLESDYHVPAVHIHVSLINDNCQAEYLLLILLPHKSANMCQCLSIQLTTCTLHQSKATSQLCSKCTIIHYTCYSEVNTCYFTIHVHRSLWLGYWRIHTQKVGIMWPTPLCVVFPSRAPIPLEWRHDILPTSLVTYCNRIVISKH